MHNPKPQSWGPPELRGLDKCLGALHFTMYNPLNIEYGGYAEKNRVVDMNIEHF